MQRVAAEWAAGRRTTACRKPGRRWLRPGLDPCTLSACPLCCVQADALASLRNYSRSPSAVDAAAAAGITVMPMPSKSARPFKKSSKHTGSSSQAAAAATVAAAAAAAPAPLPPSLRRRSRKPQHVAGGGSGAGTAEPEDSSGGSVLPQRTSAGNRMWLMLEQVGEALCCCAAAAAAAGEEQTGLWRSASGSAGRHRCPLLLPAPLPAACLAAPPPMDALSSCHLVPLLAFLVRRRSLRTATSIRRSFPIQTSRLRRRRQCRWVGGWVLCVTGRSWARGKWLHASDAGLASWRRVYAQTCPLTATHLPAVTLLVQQASGGKRARGSESPEPLAFHPRSCSSVANALASPLPSDRAVVGARPPRPGSSHRWGVAVSLRGQAAWFGRLDKQRAAVAADLSLLWRRVMASASGEVRLLAGGGGDGLLPAAGAAAAAALR